jgi:hypothetical protein
MFILRGLDTEKSGIVNSVVPNHGLDTHVSSLPSVSSRPRRPSQAMLSSMHIPPRTPDSQEIYPFSLLRTKLSYETPSHLAVILGDTTVPFRNWTELPAGFV